jgi:hypothetical protein
MSPTRWKRSIQQIQLRRNALLLEKFTAQGDSVRFEDPEWISEMCQSLEFRLKFLCRFKRPGHITVNEALVFKSWVKESVSSRAVALLDSRVTMGAVAKGRSSSFALSRILRGTPGYILGSGLYPGLLHCYSADNRADGPTRLRPIDPPTRAVWGSQSFGRADQRAFMQSSVRSGVIKKIPVRWLRLLLLLAGDIEENPGQGEAAEAPWTSPLASLPRPPQGRGNLLRPFAPGRQSICQPASS